MTHNTQKDTHVHIECNVVTFPDKKVIVFLKIYFDNRFNQSNSSEGPYLVYYSIPWLYSQVSQSVYWGKRSPEYSLGHQNLLLVFAYCMVQATSKVIVIKMGDVAVK